MANNLNRICSYWRMEEYLPWRINLDSKLSFNHHIKHSLLDDRKMFGLTWSLMPNLVYWLYCTVIRLMANYASLLLWCKTRNRKIWLRKLRKLAWITRACPLLSTTSTAIIETLLSLRPLRQDVRVEPQWAFRRLRVLNKQASEKQRF